MSHFPPTPAEGASSSSYCPSLSDQYTPPSSISSTASPSLIELPNALFKHLVGNLDLVRIREDLVEIAHKAGQMMLDADPSVDTSCSKQNSSDRVTATDKAIEDMVRNALAGKHPTIEFLGEETSKAGQCLSDDPTFVVDPIDGTLNFIHGYPNVAISLALAVQKKPVVGVVFNPFRNDLFTAIRGRGSFYTRPNGTTVSLPIRKHPEPIGSLNDCLVAVEWGSQRTGPNWELRTDVARKLLTSKAAGGAMVHSVRSAGSAALDFCYVAAGWNDMFWEGGCWIWDVCAGWVIVEEAGGIVAGANPGEWEPTLEGRSYFAVRGAPSGQREAVEELWGCMDDRKFNFSK